MPFVQIEGVERTLSTYVAIPERHGPWPGVVVIHDASGMGQDLRSQADWLAEAGFLAAAPDLFAGGTILRCVREIIRDVALWQGRMAEEIGAVRAWLSEQRGCNGRIGIIGFCMGGAFALLLAPPEHGFAAASANYGALPEDAEKFLQGACPIVGSYGARDRTLPGAAGELESVLTAIDVPHDIKEYPNAGHGFLNNHPRGEVPFLFLMLGRAINTAYHEPSALDARRRIVTFFAEHLQPQEG